MSGPLERVAGTGILSAGEYGEHVRARLLPKVVLRAGARRPRERPGCGNLVTEAVLYRYACLSSNTPA